MNLYRFTKADELMKALDIMREIDADAYSGICDEFKSRRWAGTPRVFPSDHCDLMPEYMDPAQWRARAIAAQKQEQIDAIEAKRQNAFLAAQRYERAMKASPAEMARRLREDRARQETEAQKWRRLVMEAREPFYDHG